MREFRRILLDGYPVVVTREGGRLHAKDGRSVAMEDAIHLPPTEPRKIICVHLNYKSRVDEFMVTLPATPTYFHKPVSALCGHPCPGGAARALPVAELRGRDRHRHRPALPEHRARGGL